MKLVIFGVVVESLDEVLRQQGRHPLFGVFFDAGAYATVSDVPPGDKGLRAVLDWGDDPASVDVLRADAATALADVTRRLDAAHETAADGTVISVAIADETMERAPIVMFYGYQLPALGQLPPCGARDVWATWATLGGFEARPGRFLLEEEPSALDSEAESRLTTRLRQLYGE